MEGHEERIFREEMAGPNELEQSGSTILFHAFLSLRIIQTSILESSLREYLELQNARNYR